jgi:hypothetical protein
MPGDLAARRAEFVSGTTGEPEAGQRSAEEAEAEDDALEVGRHDVHLLRGRSGRGGRCVRGRRGFRRIGEGFPAHGLAAFLFDLLALLRLFGEMRDAPHDSGVRIGREMVDDLSDAAIVSRAYSSTGGDSARVAILGPTRMNYPLNMAAVDAVARYLSQVLGDED